MHRVILFVSLVMLPAVAGAQAVRSSQQSGPAVPPTMMPPAGKCRIWMEGVAPAQQPAPTDCQTALRQRPANGVVIFGPSERDEPANGFVGRPSVNATPARTEPRTDSTGRRRTEPSTKRPPEDPPAERRP